jgi:hypothetical protein
MTERFEFDDRLLNRYTVEHLERSHPALHAALHAWFAAFGDFDNASLSKLAAARGPAEVERWNAPAQAALASIPAVVKTLDTAISQLEGALAATAAFPERAQLEELLESARVNRTTLVERAPALIAQALSPAGDYEAARAAALAALERTAQRLEDMRARSTEDGRSYRELQPMVAELGEVWATLDRALAPLSRQDQRALRAPRDAELRAAAGALCRNLFDRKMRDRAVGTWPAPAIAPPSDSAPERFAAAMARGDHATARATLAPWLAGVWTAARLAEVMRTAALEVAAGFDLAEPPPAGAWHVGSNPMRYEDVRQHRTEGEVVPPEVTAANYLGWFAIQIQTEEEDGYLTDIADLASFHTIAVMTPVGERIGYLRPE